MFHKYKLYNNTKDTIVLLENNLNFGVLDTIKYYKEQNQKLI